jgi:hypothetical protein
LKILQKIPPKPLHLRSFLHSPLRASQAALQAPRIESLDEKSGSNRFLSLWL